MFENICLDILLSRWIQPSEMVIYLSPMTCEPKALGKGLHPKGSLVLQQRRKDIPQSTGEFSTLFSFFNKITEVNVYE
jgi:hypothetical protein